MQFSMPLFLRLFKTNQKRKVVIKNKMDNPRFIDEETIPLVQDEYYDNYDTPYISRVDETFTEADTTGATKQHQLYD